jgi:hypothetical protein
MQPRIKSKYKGIPEPRKAMSFWWQLIPNGIRSIYLAQHGQTSFMSGFAWPTTQACYLKSKFKEI